MPWHEHLIWRCHSFISWCLLHFKLNLMRERKKKETKSCQLLLPELCFITVCCFMITVSPTAKVCVTATRPHFIRRSHTDGWAAKHPSDGSVSQPVVQRTLAPMVLPRQKENEGKSVTNKCKWKALFVRTVMSRWRRSNGHDSWSDKSPSQIWAASARRLEHDVLRPAEAHPRLCFSPAAASHRLTQVSDVGT